MTTDQLRGAREAHPFKPFTIHLADGRSLPVPHRDYLSLSPGGGIAVVYREGDRLSIVDLVLVTELAFDAAPAATAGDAA